MNNTIRIPRPLGITEASTLYNRTNDEEHYNDLIKRIIHSYIRNNFRYNGQYMNIEQFGFITKLNQGDIYKHINSYGKELSRMGDLLTDKDLGRALLNGAFLNCLEDRSAVQQQLAIMLQSQGGTYKPFISSEVGKVLKLQIDSNNAIMQLMKLASPSSGTLIPNEVPTHNEEKGITADVAIRLFKEQKFLPLAQDDAQKERLYSIYDIENMPEVMALDQHNIDASREGLSLNDLTKLDESRIAQEGLTEDKHKNRRAKELNIDLDADRI